MNIVKFKDVMMDPVTTKFPWDMCQTFNTFFRSRYAYCVNWSYCVPIEEMTPQKFMDISRILCRHVVDNITDDNGINNPWQNWEYVFDDVEKPTQSDPEPIDISIDVFGDVHIIPFDNVIEYVDEVETDRVNSVDRLLKFNEFIPSEIDVALVKTFRTWLATTLLSFDNDYDDAVKHMLKYYANGMYDEVVKALATFGGQTSMNLLQSPAVSSCGCAGSANVLTLNTSLSLCDPLAIYRYNIYLKMVETFSELSFWQDLDVDFIRMFKLMVEQIIKLGLPLTTSQYQSDFADCSCKITADTNQELNIQRLSRLVTSLDYILDDKVSGHKTYITTALRDWATYLYERMEW